MKNVLLKTLQDQFTNETRLRVGTHNSLITYYKFMGWDKIYM